MIYLLLLLTAAALLLYVTSRWLRGELRELRAWLGERWLLLRGGESQATLVHAAERAFAHEGLDLQFMIVSRQVPRTHERLRAGHLARTPAQPLQVAVVLALAADPDAGRLYLRAIVPAADGPASDRAEFIDFEHVQSIEAAEPQAPADAAPAAGRALHIRTGDPEHPTFELAVEAEWGLTAAELERRLKDLVAHRWRPEAPPTIVR